MLQVREGRGSKRQVEKEPMSRKQVPKEHTHFASTPHSKTATVLPGEE